MKTLPSKLLILFCVFLFACETNPQKATPPESSDASEQQESTAPEKKTEDVEVGSSTTKTDNNEKTVAPIYGIDVSKFQGDEVSTLDKHKDSLVFIICKATEGITYTDPEFKNNWTSIAEKDYVRGAYHFYRSNDDPGKQAEHFLHAISDIAKTDLPPIVDFEGGGIDKSQSIEAIRKGLVAFLNNIEAGSNRIPMIYTDIPSGNKYLDHDDFSKYPLWIALYEDLKEPHLPKAWEGQDWLFWQKTSSYKIGTRKNDFDVFNGDVSALKRFVEAH